MQLSNETQSVLIRARALTGFATLVANHGGQAELLLRRFGIDPQLLDNPENALSLSAVACLLDHAATVLGIPDIGLRLSGHQDISVVGAVAMIVRNSATIAEALEAIGRHIPYHSPGSSLQLEDGDVPGYARLRYALELDEDLPRRQAMELSYALLYQFLRLTSNASGADWQINFRHRRGMPAGAYRKYFTCPVTFGNSSDSLSFNSDLLEMPINQANPELRALAERFLRNVERRYPLDLRRQVLELIGRQLANGGASIANIAQMMGMHRRTLQRRLKTQGAHFEDLLDEIRRDRAIEYLGYGAIPIAQVALRVGYSGQTAFTHACKRWFGATPQKYRIQRLSAIGCE